MTSPDSSVGGGTSVTADANKVSPAEFFNTIFGPREPAEMRRIRFLASTGRETEARKYLEALNRVRRAFGNPELLWPVDLVEVEHGIDPLSGNHRVAA